MNRKALLVSMSCLALAAIAGCDATQPRPRCRAQQAEYAARYTVVGTPGAACAGKVLTAEVLNLAYYRPKDIEKAYSLAIEPVSVRDAMSEAEHEMKPHTGVTFSQGSFTTPEPDDTDLCKAPTMSDTDVTVAGTHISYKWSNLTMLVRPLSNAIHFGADLTRVEGDCTVTYKVAAVYPSVGCGSATKPVLDDDGKQKVDDMGKPLFEPDYTRGKPDPTRCEPVTGSGISPDFTLTCDASADGTSGSHLCVPSKPFPSLK
jgi:hypothetical protein